MLLYAHSLTSSSITFERVPSDYAILKIVQPPQDAGGDTLWASGYEAFDRLSPAFQKLAEGLTATHHQPEFNRTAAKYGLSLIDDERGAPENTGLDFQASHPVVRTFCHCSSWQCRTDRSKAPILSQAGRAFSAPVGKCAMAGLTTSAHARVTF